MRCCAARQISSSAFSESGILGTGKPSASELSTGDGDRLLAQLLLDRHQVFDRTDYPERKLAFRAAGPFGHQHEITGFRRLLDASQDILATVEQIFERLVLRFDVEDLLDQLLALRLPFALVPPSVSRDCASARRFHQGQARALFPQED